MYLGIDIGTSAVKTLLVNHEQNIIAVLLISLDVTRPRPGWSEQQPQQWWQGVNDCIDGLKIGHPSVLSDVHAIGLSGQIHSQFNIPNL